MELDGTALRTQSIPGSSGQNYLDRDDRCLSPRHGQCGAHRLPRGHQDGPAHDGRPKLGSRDLPEQHIQRELRKPGPEFLRKQTGACGENCQVCGTDEQPGDVSRQEDRDAGPGEVCLGPLHPPCVTQIQRKRDASGLCDDTDHCQAKICRRSESGTEAPESTGRRPASPASKSLFPPDTDWEAERTKDRCSQGREPVRKDCKCSTRESPGVGGTPGNVPIRQEQHHSAARQEDHQALGLPQLDCQGLELSTGDVPGDARRRGADRVCTGSVNHRFGKLMSVGVKGVPAIDRPYIKSLLCPPEYVPELTHFVTETQDCYFHVAPPVARRSASHRFKESRHIASERRAIDSWLNHGKTIKYMEPIIDREITELLTHTKKYSHPGIRKLGINVVLSRNGKDFEALDHAEPMNDVKLKGLLNESNMAIPPKIARLVKDYMGALVESGVERSEAKSKTCEFARYRLAKDAFDLLRINGTPIARYLVMYSPEYRIFGELFKRPVKACAWASLDVVLEVHSRGFSEELLWRFIAHYGALGSVVLPTMARVAQYNQARFPKVHNAYKHPPRAYGAIFEYWGRSAPYLMGMYPHPKELWDCVRDLVERGVVLGNAEALRRTHTPKTPCAPMCCVPLRFLHNVLYDPSVPNQASTSLAKFSPPFRLHGIINTKYRPTGRFSKRDQNRLVPYWPHTTSAYSIYCPALDIGVFSTFPRTRAQHDIHPLYTRNPTGGLRQHGKFFRDIAGVYQGVFWEPSLRLSDTVQEYHLAMSDHEVCVFTKTRGVANVFFKSWVDSPRFSQGATSSTLIDAFHDRRATIDDIEACINQLTDCRKSTPAAGVGKQLSLFRESLSVHKLELNEWLHMGLKQGPVDFQQAAEKLTQEVEACGSNAGQLVKCWCDHVVGTKDHACVENTLAAIRNNDFPVLYGPSLDNPSPNQILLVCLLHMLQGGFASGSRRAHAVLGAINADNVVQEIRQLIIRSLPTKSIVRYKRNDYPKVTIPVPLIKRLEDIDTDSALFITDVFTKLRDTNGAFNLNSRQSQDAERWLQSHVLGLRSDYGFAHSDNDERLREKVLRFGARAFVFSLTERQINMFLFENHPIVEDMTYHEAASIWVATALLPEQPSVLTIEYYKGLQAVFPALSSVERFEEAILVDAAHKGEGQSLGRQLQANAIIKGGVLEFIFEQRNKLMRSVPVSVHQVGYY